MVSRNQIKNLEKKAGINELKPVIIDNLCEPNCYPFKSKEEKRKYIDSQIEKIKKDPRRIHWISLSKKAVERNLKEDGKL